MAPIIEITDELIERVAQKLAARQGFDWARSAEWSRDSWRRDARYALDLVVPMIEFK